MKYINIRLILSAAFILLAATALYTLYHAKEFLTQQDGDLTKVNIAGRQRMLSQRMSKNALLLKENKNRADIVKLIENDYNIFSLSNQQLINGDLAKGIPPVNNPHIKS